MGLITGLKAGVNETYGDIISGDDLPSNVGVARRRQIHCVQGYMSHHGDDYSPAI
jgi:hypothetical protein